MNEEMGKGSTRPVENYWFVWEERGPDGRLWRSFNRTGKVTDTTLMIRVGDGEKTRRVDEV
jgi:hypothetical protein